MAGRLPKQFTDHTCTSHKISWQHLKNDSFLYSGNLLTLQMLWEVTISVWKYFHYFKIKSPASGDFILYIG